MDNAITYRHFMKALKRHWKEALPAVRPLTEARGSLPKASSFYAGATPGGLHVYLHFQTHKNVGGKFTINVILSRDELAPRQWHQRDEPAVVGRYIEGPNRIGGFLDTRRGDRWWVLCRDEVSERLGERTGLDFKNGDYWYPEDYDDVDRIVADAVADVTRSVRMALDRLTRIESGVEPDRYRSDPGDPA